MSADLARPSPRRRLRTTLGVTLVGALVATLGTLAPSPPARAAEPADARDGKSAFSAAASCWEIKQRTPASPSGVYWLQTPTMVDPEQFYCDQTTDGGGWVLVGRGRTPWTFYAEGAGTPAQVRDPITGTSAFAPRMLSNAMIDGLLNGGRVDALADGVRLRRALDQTGSTWQEGRVLLRATGGWTWAFGGGLRISAFNFDGSLGSSAYTDNFGLDNLYRRSVTNNVVYGRWNRPGFAFGDSVTTGSSAAGSYIWSATTGQAPALPFTQVWLRPRITSDNLTYTAVPAGGMAAQSIGKLALNRSVVSSWGVTGLANKVTNESSVEVAAMAEVGGVMYVGGNFTEVRKNNANAVAQPYLAGFDVRTGEWLSTFRPKLNGQVKALLGLPNGDLLVGGEFTQVNGASKVALATLDAKTGATSSAFTVTVENNLASGVTVVRDLKKMDDWIYVGGSFTHLAGGSRPLAQKVYARNAARISWNTSTPDANWNPNFNGTVYSMWPSTRKDRVYAAGWFNAMGAATTEFSTNRAVALTTSTPARPQQTWNVFYSHPTDYQQGVIESGDMVFLGGSQHSNFVYDRNTLTKVAGGITTAGGDFQAYGAVDGIVYGGNHGNEFYYTDATQWRGTDPAQLGPWTAVNKWGFVGGFSDKDGSYQVDFSPILSARNGLGPWAVTVDSTGVLWIGGDFTASRNTAEATQWNGGFVRFPMRDSTPPSAPKDTKWTNAAGSSTFTWTAATDASGAVTYEVIVNGRVRATTTATTATTPLVPTGNSVVVRAKDASGNRSATIAPLTAPGSGGGVTPTDPPTTPPAGTDPKPGEALVAADATWSYQWDGTTTPAGWTTAGFDAKSWRTGKAPIGYGATGMNTALTTSTSPKPLAAYFRHTFQVTDPANIPSIDFWTLADDGVAVYLNGAELKRANLPSGTLGIGTYATLDPTTTMAKANPVRFTVPGSRLVKGTNVLAVEVHLNWRNTPDLTMQLTATVAGDDVPDPGSLQVVDYGAAWKYRYTTGNPPSGWNQASTDESAFKEGPTTIGFGADVATSIDIQPYLSRPLTAYFRKTVQVDPATTGDLQISTWADDGIVVYVNGTEVGRKNMPAGTPGSGTYATLAPRTTAAKASPLVVTVPRTRLVKGTNVIAAEVHVNWRGTPDMTFDLEAAGKG